MFNKNITLLLCACALLCTESITANVIWPGLIIREAIIQIWFLIGISILIEAAVFYFYLKDVSYFKALLMSLTGNAISSLLGLYTLSSILTLAVAFLTLPLVFILDAIMHLSFNIKNKIDWAINWASMFLISVLIELLTIKLLFKYPAKKLWVPILIGNLITYALIPVFYYMILQKPLPHFH